jgi:hypothetical protein
VGLLRCFAHTRGNTQAAVVERKTTQARCGGGGAALGAHTLSTTGSESVWPMSSGSYEDSWEKKRAGWAGFAVLAVGMDL